MTSGIKVLVTLPKNDTFYTFFNNERISQLEEVADVIWNESEEQLTKEQLCTLIMDVDVMITGWGTMLITEDIVQHANKLKLIAHTGGTVQPYVAEDVYRRGIRVVSGNNIFAQSVAESVIAYALASLRDIPKFATELKQGVWPTSYYNRGLLNKKIGIVGYGMIAKYTVDMLKPFHPELFVFSKHVEEEELNMHNMTFTSLEYIFKHCDIISLHLSSTPETYNMIDERLLSSMKENALLINTARGAILDEQALVKVMKKKSIYAALDVYEVEPLEKNHPLMTIEQALLMPHMGGPTVDRRLVVTKQIIDEIKNFFTGQPLICEITEDYARNMTR